MQFVPIAIPGASSGFFKIFKAGIDTIDGMVIKQKTIHEKILAIF
jgi:hypothetical protein